jgi:hypothetical protein
MRVERWYYFFFLIIVATACCFYNPWLLNFQNDDFIELVKDIRNPGFHFSIRPIGDLSIQFDKILFGKEPAGFHFTNLLLHTLCSILTGVLVYTLDFKIANISNRLFAITTATVFFIYAFDCEAVFWILGRSAILGNIFFLIALICYIRSERFDLKFFTACCAFVLGLLSYESIMIFLPVIVLYDLLVRKKIKLRNWLIIFSILIIYLSERFFVYGVVIREYDGSLWLHMNIVGLITNYIKFLPRIFLPPLHTTAFIISAFIFYLLFGFVLFRSIQKRNNLMTWLLPVLLIAPLPYLSIGINIHNVEAGRFLYMPVVFAVIIIVRTVFHFKHGAILLGIFGAIHLWSLFNAATVYRTAGNIVSVTGRALANFKDQTVITVYNLPQTNNGATIFRSGFEEAVHFYNPNITNIIVVTKGTTDDSWNRNYNLRMSSKLRDSVMMFYRKNELQVKQ